MKKITLLVGAALALYLTACGKNEPVNTAESQRAALGPEILGTWESKCQQKTVHRVTLDEKKINFERTKYFDPECQERINTTKHTSSYSLAHNYKTGIENSIVLVPDQDVTVTLWTDSDTDKANESLTSVHNLKETEIKETLAVAAKKNLVRENLKIRTTKTLDVWKRDQPKALSRLQLEMLAGRGLDAAAVAEQGSLVSIRYEVDNGYLQLTGPGEFGHVYQKNQ